MNIGEIFSSTVLKGTVTVVTGAGRGLGRSMALALAQAGSDLVVVARNLDELERTAREIKALGAKAFSVPADVTRPNEICRIVEKSLFEFGKIDVLVNNAGQNASYVQHKFEDIPQNEWESMVNTNVTGLFLVTQAVGRIMLSRRAGKVINIASALGVRAAPERLCYSVSKAAVIQITRALAAEWAPRGVTVNCIAPGSLDLNPESTDEKHLSLNETRKKRIPLERIGRLEDVGPAIVYLASSASDYVTGATLFIDGGMSVG